MKKQLLFVINSMQLGGAEKSLLSLLSLFDYEKYSVELLMLSPGGEFLPLLDENVRLVPTPEYYKYCHRGFFSAGPRFQAARLKTSAALRSGFLRAGLHDAQVFWRCAGSCIDGPKKQYDAAFAWGQGNPTHLVADKVRAKRKLAVINANYRAAGHNADFDLPYYEKYDKILCVSDELLKLTRTFFPSLLDKLDVLYDINNAEMITKMAELYDPEFERETAHIVSVGRLAPLKGFDLAVEAAGELKGRGLDFCWHIVGDGSEREALLRQISRLGLEKYVILEGAKLNPYPYMKNARVCVQSSRSEGYCLTLYEARVLGKPCVCTCFDTVYNQITNGVNGIITGFEPRQLADGIEKMLTDGGLREAIVSNVKREKKGNTEELKKVYALIEGDTFGGEADG